MRFLGRIFFVLLRYLFILVLFMRFEMLSRGERLYFFKWKRVGEIEVFSRERINELGNSFLEG